MQAVQLYLLVLTTLSCGFAQESSLPDSADSILLDLRKFMFPTLNQTISDLLEEIKDMKMDIMRNKEKITQTQSSMVLLSKDVEDLTDEVEGVQGDVAAVQGEVIAVAEDVERNSADITTLKVMGHWCATQSSWDRVVNSGIRDTVGTITYDRLTYSDSNMNFTGTPLDIKTGKYRIQSVLQVFLLSGY